MARPKITHASRRIAQRWRTVSAPPRVRLSNYRRHAHRGGTGDRASADPGIDERPVPQPRRKDVALARLCRSGTSAFTVSLGG